MCVGALVGGGGSTVCVWVPWWGGSTVCGWVPWWGGLLCVCVCALVVVGSTVCVLVGGACWVVGWWGHEM